MEHKQHLLIWRDANRLLLEIEQILHRFPRFHKYAAAGHSYLPPVGAGCSDFQ